MNYSENYKRNVKKEGIVEKKGQFDYISWAFCEKIANELDPNFNWELVTTADDNFNHGGFVKIKMLFNEKTRTHYYPILDFKNKPIATPTPFDINNAQMRGMAKLFSMMSGLGLSLFTGEDLRIYEQKEVKAKPVAKAQEFVNAADAYSKATPNGFEAERQKFINVADKYAKLNGMTNDLIYKNYKLTKESTLEDFKKATKDLEEKIVINEIEEIGQV